MIVIFIECPGVGPKVADCVSLMSMGFHHIIPMDTHMIQVAEKYGISSKPPSKKRKLLKENRNQNSSATINKKVNNVNDGIQSQFQHLFGVYAGSIFIIHKFISLGWAQSVLFAADLKWLETSKNS